MAAAVGEFGVAGILLQVGDGAGYANLSSADDADPGCGSGGGRGDLRVLLSGQDGYICKTAEQHRARRAVGGVGERDGLGGVRAGIAVVGVGIMCGSVEKGRTGKSRNR